MERKAMKNGIRYSVNAKRELGKWCRLIGGAGYKDFSVILKRLKMEKLMIPNTKRGAYNMLVSVDNSTIIAETIYIVPC